MSARRLGPIAAILVAVAVAAGAGAQPASYRPVTPVLVVEDGPKVDGVLDDAVWERAAPLQELVQVEPVLGGEPTFRTDIRIVRTDRALYFGIKSYDDEPSRIIARRMDRDTDLLPEDRIAIAIDTFRDGRSGFLFQINPLGTRVDWLIRYDQLIREWDTIWQARARITDEGWELEVELPFQSLNFDPGEDGWGLNVLRAIRRTDERLRWANISLDSSFINMTDAGVMTGMKGARQGLGVDVVPSATVRRVDDNVIDEHDFEFKPSADVFWKPVPELTAVLTANTDFAETEADVGQINLSRFPLFFPEKRDFFLQDATIFEFGGLEQNGRPFFSRRIGLVDGQEVPILLGGKLTGRWGPLNFGLLETWTDEAFGIERKSLGVHRVTADVGPESSVGMIVTHGDPSSNDHNWVVGADAVYRRSDLPGGKVLQARGWFQHSFTSRVKGNRAAFGGEIEYPNDRVNWLLGYQELGENFDPRLGFVARPDIRQYDASYRYRFRPTGLRTVDTRVSGVMITDRANVARTASVTAVPVAVTTRPGDFFELGYLFEYERPRVPFEIAPGIFVPAEPFYAHRLTWTLNSAQSRRLRAGVSGSVGGFLSGTLVSVRPSITWRPSAHWLFGIDYLVNDVRLAEGDFTRQLVIGRVDVNFSVDLFWNTLVQYEDLFGTVTINSRLRWIIVPGREVFVVLNQAFGTRGSPTLLRSEPIIKVRWTFRF